LAHLEGDRAITALIGIRNNADPCVRHAVANGLGRTSRPEAIQTLIELMEDTDDDVRDWATFGLGVSTGDSPQIREAFRRSLNDTFLDVRQEAIWGLARRKDPEGLLLLLEQLEAHVWAAGDEWACM